MKKWVILMALLLSSCESVAMKTETINLAKQGSPAVQCGPYLGYGGLEFETAQANLRSCVSDYQRQGYQRVASPSN